jgi:hypothetical protein
VADNFNREARHGIQWTAAAKASRHLEPGCVWEKKRGRYEQKAVPWQRPIDTVEGLRFQCVDNEMRVAIWQEMMVILDASATSTMFRDC